MNPVESSFSIVALCTIQFNILFIFLKLEEFPYVDFLSSSSSPPAASVHSSERAAGHLLVVHCPVRLHVPGQPVCHRVPLLLPAGLLGLPAVCLRLHVSLVMKHHFRFFIYLMLLL